jgi:hypothetical protein
MQVCLSDVQVSATQRGKISVLGLTLDKALYMPWCRSDLCPRTCCTHTLQYKTIHDFLSVLPNLGKNQKSIIYTRCRSNLVLTTSGSFCSGGTRRCSNAPSHTDTEPDGSLNSRSVTRVHVLQQEFQRPEKTQLKYCVFYIVLCCSTA